MGSDTGANVHSALEPVVEWLRARNADLDVIPPDLDLIESRLIDSLAFMEFILLLEDLMGRELVLEQLSIDQFRTLDAIFVNFLKPPDA